jgi:RHS repeat-associated protein
MPAVYYHLVGGKIRGQTAVGRRDYLTDALGSITATTDSAAHVENRYRSKPSGGLLSKAGIATDSRFLWTGDTGSRLTGCNSAEQYNIARHYGTRLARWVSVDPSWPVETAYIYSRANPTSILDPGGMACLMKQADIEVKLSTWPRCTAVCVKNWWDPESWSCGRCLYDLNSLMEIMVTVRGCKNCVMYQWVSEDGGPYRRDSALGWPYPWTCTGKGKPWEFCNTNDNPYERGTFTPCAAYFSRELNFITCVCCSGFSGCFKWGVYHSASGCNAFCDHWGPTWLGKNASLYNCLWAAQ